MELAFLSPLVARPDPWASVYLDTSRRSESAAEQQELEARSAVDRLSQQGGDDATCREARADDALLRSAAATGAEALTVARGPETSDGLPAGGLGAVLRWPYDSGPR
jgi:hypothetical protein